MITDAHIASMNMSNVPMETIVKLTFTKDLKTRFSRARMCSITKTAIQAVQCFGMDHVRVGSGCMGEVVLQDVSVEDIIAFWELTGEWPTEIII